MAGDGRPLRRGRRMIGSATAPSGSGSTRRPRTRRCRSRSRAVRCAAAATAASAGSLAVGKDGAPAAAATAGDELTARPHATAATPAAAGDERAAGMPPPPPPPPPQGLELARMRRSEGALRVGGTIKPPMKVRNVSPSIRRRRRRRGCPGVVIIEARIEADGTVSRARVLQLDPDAGRRGGRGGAAVGVHADAGERRSRRRSS